MLGLHLASLLYPTPTPRAKQGYFALPPVNSVVASPCQNVLEQFLGLVRVLTRELEHCPVDPGRPSQLARARACLAGRFSAVPLPRFPLVLTSSQHALRLTFTDALAPSPDYDGRVWYDVLMHILFILTVRYREEDGHFGISVPGNAVDVDSDPEEVPNNLPSVYSLPGDVLSCWLTSVE